MNKLEELERNLKIAYLNYENNNLNETLKYLDRDIEMILEDDESINNDPFWKSLTSNVFKAVILNNFYNKNELTGNDLDSLLANEEEMMKSIKEFCNNFKNNELIGFINHIENITDKPLKSVIKIIMTNIGKLNIKSISVIPSGDENDNSNNKVQKIDCFCGNSFDFDWAKIPETEKIIYMRCPNCDSELKRSNPYYKNTEISYGTFIDINDIEGLKIYSRNYNNIYGDNPNIYSPIDNPTIPEKIATNWIIKQNNFKIISELIVILHGNNHDEECYIEKKEIKENFYYDSNIQNFKCEKNNEKFILIPSRKSININNITYNIPMIEVHNYSPEKLGLIDINNIQH